MDRFRTHTGEIVTGERLAAARRKVAEDWRAMAYAIREEDAYASHVTEAEKDEYLQRHLDFADRIEIGEPEAGGFTSWQRINQELTGECAGLFAR